MDNGYKKKKKKTRLTRTTSLLNEIKGNISLKT